MSNKWMSQFCKDEKNTLAGSAKQKSRVFLSTPSLNWALGGGLYRGYTTCMYGPEGGGKSLISMLGIAAIHRSNSDAIAVLVSTEMRSPTPEKLIQLGVDPDRLVIRQVNTLHDVFDWIASPDDNFENSDKTHGGPGLSYMLEQGAPVQALVIDSVKGIQGPKEQASESTETHIMGDLSFFLNPALRKILPVIRNHDLMTILIQQVNMNMDPNEVKYQNIKWKVPGGQSLKHFCETMCLIERVNTKDGKMFSETETNIRELPVQEGHTIRVKVEKANLDAPFREAEFRINYRTGIVDTGLEVAKLATGLGIITHPVNPGTGKPVLQQWQYKDQKWIGFDKMVDELEAKPELQRQVMVSIYEKDVQTKPKEGVK